MIKLQIGGNLIYAFVFSSWKCSPSSVLVSVFFCFTQRFVLKCLLFCVCYKVRLLKYLLLDNVKSENVV